VNILELKVTRYSTKLALLRPKIGLCHLKQLSNSVNKEQTSNTRNRKVGYAQQA